MVRRLRQGDRLGEYELLLPIGHGGMAEVWAARAWGGDSAELFAIKVIHPSFAKRSEFVRMFFAEADLLKSIRHPNVVDVYDAQHTQGLVFMVLEWIDGDSLHELIAEAGKRRPVPADLAVRIIADAALGLHAAHELCALDGTLAGVVHQDISPHNILIRSDGMVKLVDFGVAKVIGGVEHQAAAFGLRGKFSYMSPEQALSLPLDRRSDVFSLGIVLYELTTGRRLFLGRNEAHTMQLVVSGEIPRPSQFVHDYPPTLEYIVMKALERRFQKRYPNAEELRLDLEAYLREQRVVVPCSGVGALLHRVLGEKLAERREDLLLAMHGEERITAVRSSDWSVSENTRPGRRRRGDRGHLLARVRRWASGILSTLI